MEKLSKNHDLARLKAIGGAAQVSANSLTILQLLTLIPASPRLVEGVSDPAFGFSRPSAAAAHTACAVVLAPKCGRRAGHVCTHPRACPRGRSRRSRNDGGPCRDMRSVKSDRGTNPEGSGGVAGYLEEHRTGAARELVPCEFDVRGVCWYG